MSNMDSFKIVQPAVDDWSYRCLRLPNGLQALLVSDPAADKAAAAMDVRSSTT